MTLLRQGNELGLIAVAETDAGPQSQLVATSDDREGLKLLAKDLLGHKSGDVDWHLAIIHVSDIVKSLGITDDGTFTNPTIGNAEPALN